MAVLNISFGSSPRVAFPMDLCDQAIRASADEFVNGKEERDRHVTTSVWSVQICNARICAYHARRYFQRVASSAGMFVEPALYKY